LAALAKIAKAAFLSLFAGERLAILARNPKNLDIGQILGLKAHKPATMRQTRFPGDKVVAAMAAVDARH
jgi:hypothetical protein